MTIERVKGRLTMMCDGCSEFFEPEDQTDFRAAIREARDEGWSTFRLGEEWMHHCPDCAKKRGTS